MQEGHRFAIRPPVDQGRAEMALEGLERIAGCRVELAAGLDLIALARQRALNRSQIGRARCRRGPEADAGLGKRTPVEELAGVDLARGCHVGMGRAPGAPGSDGG